MQVVAPEMLPGGIQAKPKLLFIRSTASGRASFIRTHLQEHVKCLSSNFDVVLVDREDCDYRLLCATHKPDLALFESGVYVSMAKARNIRNTEAFPEIPKLGLCNADAYCTTRKVFLSDMYRWNVDTFFSISLSMGDYTPEISENLFVWPNFADGDVYKDYGERKNIPILFTGSLAMHYPWRNRIYKRLRSLYPTMLCPHFGWGKDQDTNRTIFGEQYARLLNAALFVPSCGTIANDLVRKHLEIPASRACLIAERSSALDAAGFSDMENCVFADESDAIDKLDHLLTHPDELQRITQAGYDMARRRHMLTHRDQIHQWFILRKRLGSSEKIVQPGPFQQLVIVPKDSQIRNSHAPANGIDRKLLRMGDEKLECGKYAEARELFVRCLNYHLMAEPSLRLVILSLYQGDTVGAQQWSLRQLALTLERHCATTPDPVEWAYAILVELCCGRPSKAWEYAQKFAFLRHRELDRARFVAAAAAGDAPERLATWGVSKESYSIHQLPKTDFKSWVRKLKVMLVACGQSRLLERISSERIDAALFDTISTRLSPAKSPSSASKSSLPEHPAPVTRFRHRSYLKGLKHPAKMLLHKTEKVVGYFLPYKASSARSDPFYQQLEHICADERCEAIAIIGAKADNYITEACIQGAQMNPRRPVVGCVCDSGERFEVLYRRHSGDRSIRVLKVPSSEARSFMRGTTLLVLDGSEMTSNKVEFVDIDSPQIIVLLDINNSSADDIHHELMANSDYELMDYDPNGEGYSIFARIPNICTSVVEQNSEVLRDIPHTQPS